MCSSDLHENNFSHKLFFEGAHDSLTIKTTAEVETKDHDPFNYVIHPPQASKLPFEYNSSVRHTLQAYLDTYPIPDDIHTYTEALKEETNSETIPFLMALTQSLTNTIENEYREFGDPYPPIITFREKKGACRDKSVLFMVIARSLGLAARYVSGYYYNGKDKSIKPELHAWVEIYIPGGGWKGFDPSHGLKTQDDHISICTSSLPELCAPIRGTYVGTAQSTLTTKTSIQEK